MGAAWVAWRNGAGYVGWAPLPPEVGWDSGTGLRLGGFNLDAGIYRPSWIFVEEHHFLEPRLHQVFIEPARNITIIERTRNVTDYVTINHHIVNRGLPVQRIEQVTGRRVERFRVSEVVTVAATRVATECAQYRQYLSSRRESLFKPWAVNAPARSRSHPSESASDSRGAALGGDGTNGATPSKGA